MRRTGAMSDATRHARTAALHAARTTRDERRSRRRASSRHAPAPTGAAVPPVRTIVLDRAPVPVLPPREREAVRAATSTRPRAAAPRGREHRLRRQKAGQVGLAVDPPGRGAGADRSLGLRQDDAAAHAQPAHRADAERVARGQRPARRRGHPRDGRHDAALARGDGLPAAQPLPDVDLRQRRLRPARTVAQAPAHDASSSRR